MREDVYKAAISFLNRVDLKGAEVDAMVMVRQSITDCYQNALAKKEKVAETVVLDNAEEN